MTPSGPKKLFRRRRSYRPMVLVAFVAVVVAAGSVWLLTRSSGPATVAGTSPSASVTKGSSPTPPVVGSPKIKGVVVQVLNGTARRGLATRTSEELARAGFTLVSPANSDTRRTLTLIAYRPKFLADAAFIRRVYLPHAVLQESFVAFPSGADITLVLGPDAPG
jgi:hypothetical protein